ncbi:MAG: hypothetical protein JOZ08_16065 [Verrucomicrobia bacterium]|nr:hypothetical protein [Verrucomicrobiota bacterium]MBV8279161.1 hypothetical protein [Verrucomicrobiota bacterium]
MPLPEQYRTLRVVVVGSYNTDLVIWSDLVPVEGQSLVGGEFDMFGGGRGANCAVAAARAGCQVKFVGGHGKDMFGQMAVERLAREHIDISHFIELPASKTGVALVYQRRKTGGNAVLVTNSANHQLPATLVTKAESAIRQSDLVFTQFEIAPSVVSEVYRVCNRHNKRLVVHASPVQPPIPFPRGHYCLLVADGYEILQLTGRNRLSDAIEELHHRGVQNAIVRHGHTSLTVSNGKNTQVELVQNAEFLQDLGAAECLTAWAGITLALTGDLVRAASVGAEAMAFNVSRRGAQDSMPYPSELPIDWLK